MDLGIIIFLSLNTAPILSSSGKLEFLISLLINSEVSIISASITSYSPSDKVYAFSIVPLWICFKILETVVSLGSIKSSIFSDY